MLEEAKTFERARLNPKAWLEWVYSFSTPLRINPGRDQLEICISQWLLRHPGHDFHTA